MSIQLVSRAKSAGPRLHSAGRLRSEDRGRPHQSAPHRIIGNGTGSHGATRRGSRPATAHARSWSGLVERSRGDLSTIRSYSQSALIALPPRMSPAPRWNEHCKRSSIVTTCCGRAWTAATHHTRDPREPGSITRPRHPAPNLHRVHPAAKNSSPLRETAMQDASSRLDPEHGKMISAVWLDPVSSNGDRAEAGRLLLVLHHLAVDGVSWRMLVPGLVTAYASAFDGETPILPPGGTSIRRWATALAETAAQRRDEIDLWSRMRDRRAIARGTRARPSRRCRSHRRPSQRRRSDLRDRETSSRRCLSISEAR